MPAVRGIGDRREFAGYGLLFAALYGGYGALSPFLPAFLAERGLDPEGIARLLAAAMLVRLVAGPLAGRWADRHRATRGLLALCLALAGLCTVAFLAGRGFPALLVLALAQAVATAPMSPLADALALRAASGGRAFAYGRVRAAGSAAFVAASIVAGYLIAATDNASGLWLGGGLFLLAAFLTTRVQTPDSHKSPHPEVPAPAGLEGGLQPARSDLEGSFEGDAPRRRLRMRGWMGAADAQDGVPALIGNARFRRVVLCSGLVMGAHAMHDAFAVIVWREAGLSAATAGWLWSESVAAEIAVFVAVGPWLLARIGPARVLMLANLAGALRWAVQAETTWLPAMVGIQGLHGLTFAALHLACLAVIAKTVPEKLRATALTLYATGLGVATALVTLAAGSLYAALGMRAFLAMAALSLAALPAAWSVRDGTRVHSAPRTST